MSEPARGPVISADPAMAEEALEPDLPLCDTHFHFYERDSVTPPSSTGLWDSSGHVPYDLDDYCTDMSGGHNVVATVFAECGTGYLPSGPEAFMPVGESRFVAAKAAEAERLGCPPIRGIVAMADLSCGDLLEAVLDEHVEASAGLISGIRVRATYDTHRHEFMPGVAQPHRGLLADPSFRDGVRMLGHRRLTLDAWVFHTQLHEVAELARAVPDTDIVVTHMGAPLGVARYRRHTEDVERAWRSAMRELSALPNVNVKLGGIGVYLFGHDWWWRTEKPSSDEIASEFSDRVDYVIQEFGPSRCMFESNFPVDRFGCSYNNLWNAFKKITLSYSAEERRQLFHDSAMRMYRLDDAGPTGSTRRFGQAQPENERLP